MDIFIIKHMFTIKTKKKDKRIFHSLGTKDKDTASKKKIELDNKYENKVVGHFSLQNLASKKRIYSLLTFGVLASIFLLFYNQLIEKYSRTANDKVEVYDEIENLPTTFKKEFQIVDVKDSIYNEEVEDKKTLKALDNMEEVEIKQLTQSTLLLDLYKFQKNLIKGRFLLPLIKMFLKKA